MLIGSKSGFTTSSSSLPKIDGIMMIGWSIDTGLCGSDATSSFGISLEVILPDFSYLAGETDFIGNYVGNAKACVLLGTMAASPYAYVANASRAPSMQMTYNSSVSCSVLVDYSGSLTLDFNGTQKTDSITTSYIAGSSGKFLIGCGGAFGGMYKPRPTVFERVTFTIDGVVVADYMPTIYSGKIGMKDVIRGTFEYAPPGGVTLAYNSDFGGGVNA